MGLGDEVRTVCQDSEDSLLARKAEEWAARSESDCKAIITAVKKIIKAKRDPPRMKLRALQVPPT